MGKRDSDLAGHSYGNLFSRDTSVFVGLDFRRFFDQCASGSTPDRAGQMDYSIVTRKESK